MSKLIATLLATLLNNKLILKWVRTMQYKITHRKNNRPAPTQHPKTQPAAQMPEKRALRIQGNDWTKLLMRNTGMHDIGVRWLRLMT